MGNVVYVVLLQAVVVGEFIILVHHPGDDVGDGTRPPAQGHEALITRLKVDLPFVGD